MNLRELGRHHISLAAIRLGQIDALTEQSVVVGASPLPQLIRPNDSRPVASPPVVFKPAVGRNAPCPCGSGKKYKKCHRPG